MDLNTWTRIESKLQNMPRLLHIRAMIPSVKVGKIMGPGGSVHRKLQQAHNVHVQLSEFPAHGGRLLHVEGETKDMPNFWRQVLHLAFKDQPIRVGVDDVGINFLFSQGFVELLEADDIFHTLAKESKTKVTVKSNPMPNSTEFMVRIAIPRIEHHTLDCFRHAVHILSKQLDLNQMAALSTPGTVFYSIPAPSSNDEDYFFKRNNDIIYDYTQQ